MDDDQRSMFLTKSEAAEALGVSLPWLERLLRTGLIKTVEEGGATCVRATDVRAYAEARGVVFVPPGKERDHALVGEDRRGKCPLAEEDE